MCNSGSISSQSTFLPASNGGGVSSGINNRINTMGSINIAQQNNNNNNMQQQQIIFNDTIEQYDHIGAVDFVTDSVVVNGSADRYSHLSGFGNVGYDRIELSDEFKKNYERWLEDEVYSTNIDWELLKTPYDII